MVVRFLILCSVVCSIIRPCASECGTTHYDVITTGVKMTAPYPPSACKGIPFFPELEPNNRKYFRVKSGTDVAIYMSSTSVIYDRYGDDFYQIEIKFDGSVDTVRNDVALTPVGTLSGANILSATNFADLYVSVVPGTGVAGTIHLGRKDGSVIASWGDTSPSLIDVNYILVLNYNDPSEAEIAEWEFCDGELKLLSQNDESIKSAGITATQRDTDSDTDKDIAHAANAIDGDAGNGVFDENVCIALGDDRDTDGDNNDDAADTDEVNDPDLEKFAWWRIDLGDMYHVKGVSITQSAVPSDGNQKLCPKGWRQFQAQCFLEVLDPKTWDAAEADCVSRGGNLATIYSQEVQDFIVAWLIDSPLGLVPANGNHKYWIGLRATIARTFTWADGTPGFTWAGAAGGTPTPSTFTSWAASQPAQASTPSCVELRNDNIISGLAWNDETNCGQDRNYICQRKLCPANTWKIYKNYCYLDSGSAKMPWTGARTACSNLNNGDYVSMATVDTAEKQQFMEHWLSDLNPPTNERYWIGLNDMDTGSTPDANENMFVWDSGASGFTWSGGSSGTATPTSYTNWGTNQPSNSPTSAPGGDQDCVALEDTSGGGFDAFWNDHGCDGSYRYICEIKIKEVTQQTSLAGSEVRVGSCGHTGDNANWPTIIKKNDVCGAPITPAETSLDRTSFWLFRECDTNYYGRYVYIAKEDLVNTASLSLCEVQIWGMEIPATNKPKIGFTQNAVSDLQANLAMGTQTFTVMKTDGSQEHSTCLSFDVQVVAADTTAVSTTDYTTVTTLPGYQCDPNDPTTFNFDLTFVNDICEFRDHTLVFGFTSLSTGLVAGDADGVTYETLTYNIQDDDVKYRWASTSYDVMESGVTVTARLLREGYITGSSTAYVVTGGGTATANTDYIPIITGTAASQIVFSGTETFKDIIITILDDEDCPATDPDEMFTLTVSADGSCQIVTAMTTVTIIDDDTTFRFVYNGVGVSPAVEYTISETQRTTEVVIERIGYIDNLAMIDVLSQPLVPTMSAEPGIDFTSIDTTLDFQPGKSTTSFTLEITDDNLVENNEILELRLKRNPDSLPTCVLVDDSVAEVTIVDNDCNWKMMVEEVSAVENSGSAAITVVCDRPDGVVLNRPRTAVLQISSAAITDGTAATAGSDFMSSGTATVTINSGETSALINVPITNDNMEEAVEYFDVTLMSSTDGEITQPATTRVSISDDDVTVRLTSCNTDGSMIFENAGKLTVTLERTGDITAQDSVLLFTNPQSATAGSVVGEGDFVSVNTKLIFPTNQAIVSHDIIINEDGEFEGDETFVVQIRKQSQDTFVEETISRCVVTIKDNDCAFSVSVSDADKMVPENVGEISLTVTRSGYTEYTSSVLISTSSLNTPLLETDATPGVDYGALPGNTTVTFEPGQLTQIVKIGILEDAIPEIDEYFKVSLTGADCAVFGDNTILIGIKDNDEVKVAMAASSVTVNEDDGFASVTVVRSGSVARTDTVTLTILPREVAGTSSAATIDSDFSNDPITVIFEQGEERKTAQIKIIDNEIEESGLESFVVKIKEVKQNPGGAITITDATIDNDKRETLVYIRDDDGSFNLRSLGRHSESVGSITVTMDRSGTTSEVQTIYISTKSAGASNSDFQHLNLVPVTFGVGVTTQSLSINIYDDKELESSEDFLVCWSEVADREKEQCVEIVTIEDDDNEVRFITTAGTADTANSITVSEAEGTVHLTVERSGYESALPSGTTTVSISSRNLTTTTSNTASQANSADYTLTTTTLTFHNGRSRADVLIDIVDDDVSENQEVFEVYIASVSPDGSNQIGYPSTWMVYINDDDGGATNGGGDGGTAAGGGDDGGLSQAGLIGIIGGVGLVLLIAVLGLVGCFIAARNINPAGPQTRVAFRNNGRAPISRGPQQFSRQQPSYYGQQPSYGQQPGYYGQQPLTYGRR